MFKKIVFVFLVILGLGILVFYFRAKIAGIIKKKEIKQEIIVEQKKPQELVEVKKQSAFSCINKDIKTRNVENIEFLKKQGIIKEGDLIVLRAITFVDSNEKNGQPQYAYLFKNQALMMGFDLGNGEVKLFDKLPISPDEKAEIKKIDGEVSQDISQLFFLQPDYPELPVAFLENSLEKSIELLENNEKYQAETKNNPKLFEKFSAMAVYEKEKGWMWRFDFFDNTEGKNESLGFTVNPESGKEAVIVSDGKEAV
ncbi:MAG: hypothetical protein WCK16_03350 [Candidatus Moraniibacteriota bacterium]